MWRPAGFADEIHDDLRPRYESRTAEASRAIKISSDWGVEVLDRDDDQPRTLTGILDRPDFTVYWVGH
jgi:hypothetical protein